MRFPAVLLFLALGVSLTADQVPDGRQLLAHSDDPLFTARTARLQFEMRADVTVSGIETKVSTFVLLGIGSGNRFRYSVHGGERDVLVVSNGTNVWRSSSKEKTWTVAAFEPGSLRQHVENIVYGRALTNIRDARVDRKESLEIKGRRIDCYVVSAEYPKVPGCPNSGIGIRTVWLDVNQNLVWRDEWEGQVPVPSGAGPAQVRVNFVYSELEFDKEISADLFTFQPAEGTVEGKATPAPAPKVVYPPKFPLGDPLASMRKSSSGTDGEAVNGGIFRVGGDISQPAVICKVDPEYSEQARKARLSGTEVLSVIVDTQGNARHIRVLKSPGMGLDEKAAEAIQKVKFPLAMKGATPVNVRATIEVNFRGWRLAG